MDVIELVLCFFVGYLFGYFLYAVHSERKVIKKRYNGLFSELQAKNDRKTYSRNAVQKLNNSS